MPPIFKLLAALYLLLAALALLACGGGDAYQPPASGGEDGAMAADEGSEGARGPAGASFATTAPAPTTAPHVVREEEVSMAVEVTRTVAQAAAPTPPAAPTPAPAAAATPAAIAPTPAPPAPGGVLPSLPAQQRIIVRTVDLRLTVSDVAAAVDAVAALAVASGGWVVNSDRSARHGGSIAIRVPAETLDDTIRRLRELALKVESETSASQDVTDEYVDLQSRLTGLRAAETRLLELMAQAASVKDALSVQSELSNLQTQIERIEGRLKYLEQTAAYSLVKVALQVPPADLPADAGPDRALAAGAAARFRATFRPPPGLDSFNWQWDFGDGSRPAQGQASAPAANPGERVTATVTHVYGDERDSPYIVEFRITGTGASGLARGADTFIATVIQTPEIAVFAGEHQVVAENEEVQFRGSFTRPAGLRNFRYRWDFGDGSPYIGGAPAAGQTQAAATHVYPNHRPSEYNASLTVTAESDAGPVESAGYLGVYVQERPGLTISGWSLADTARAAIRALSAVGYALATALLWLAVFLPIILAIGAVIYGLQRLRRRRARNAA